jgi:hypothetical protein
MLVAVASMAQQQRLMIPSEFENLAVSQSPPLDNPVLPMQQYKRSSTDNPLFENVIGATRYDMQTNASCQNRFYLYPDGTMGGIWTYGMNDASYLDRGTGYNYYNGSSWGTAPLSRIESLRAGWPSYAPWNGNGEIVVSHHFATFPALMLTRTTKGTGAWTEVEIAPPAGAMGIDWPRMITSGPTHMSIHMIALTTPSASGGAIYDGLDGAIVYYRSQDGGATWDIAGDILPQITASDYIGFSADDYAWMRPRGDTIAFIVGGNWTDTFIMVSYDNGTNWEKIPILNNGNKLVPSGDETDIFACCDGSVALEMDNDGVFHVVFGRMRAKGDLDGRKYYPGTDGLIYWNSTMPMLHDSLYPDTLEAHGQLLGYVAENTAGDTVVGFPYYGVSLSSFPQITIDENNRIFVIWSGLTVGNPSPEEWNYRHIWSRASLDNGESWSDMTDLNSSIIYINREFVYPSMAKHTTASSIHFIYQSADVPGSAISDANVPVHDNTIEYRQEPKETLIGINTLPVFQKNVVSQNFPNPFHKQTNIDVTVEQNSALLMTVVDLLGHQVMTVNKGVVPPGDYRFTIDGSRLTPGIYFYTVAINGEKYTKKMIVE